MTGGRMTIKAIKAKVRARAKKLEVKGPPMECGEGEEGVHEDCCTHELPEGDPHHPGQVCCWCGGIFVERYFDQAEHGKYLPRGR